MLKGVRRVTYVFVVLALVAAGCGGADEADDGRVTTTEGFGTPTTVGNIPGMSAECESLTNLSIAMTSIFTGTPEEVDRLLAGVDNVPGELADDVAVLQTAIRGLAQAWAEVGVNPLSDPTALSEMSDADRERIEGVMEQFSDDATNDAFDRIGEYAVDACFPAGIGS